MSISRTLTGSSSVDEGRPRTNYKLDVQKDWDWYYDRVAREIVQAAGRAVRHDEDYATFYVLDEAFEDVCRNATFPPVV